MTISAVAPRVNAAYADIPAELTTVPIGAPAGFGPVRHNPGTLGVIAKRIGATAKPGELTYFREAGHLYVGKCEAHGPDPTRPYWHWGISIYELKLTGYDAVDFLLNLVIG